MFIRRLLNRKLGLILAGLLLLTWGTTSAFSDLARLRADQPDPLDNPDANGVQVIIPSQTLTFSTPTPQSDVSSTGLPTAVMGGEEDTFSIPLQGNIKPTPEGTKPVGLIPDRIVIPSISLDAPVKPVPYRLVMVGKDIFQQWTVPNEFAAGWQTDSAPIGVPGNTVLNGHHNEWGEVFGKLIDLKPGDFIDVYSGEVKIRYVITNKMILPEREQPLSVRFENARWLLPTQDERLTLVTCWPHWSNTHRLIVVAVPVGHSVLSDRTIKR